MYVWLRPTCGKLQEGMYVSIATTKQCSRVGMCAWIGTTEAHRTPACGSRAGMEVRKTLVVVLFSLYVCMAIAPAGSPPRG